MNTFTEQEVNILIKKTIKACGEAFLTYLEEDVIILHSLTQEQLDEAEFELTIKPDALGIQVRVTDALKTKGILLNLS